MTATLTHQALNRATLERQLLIRRERVPPLEALRRVLALQAQEAASPYVALWNRVEGFDAVDLDRAFASHEVVKSTLMRITLHAVHVDDYPALHEAMQTTLRASRLNDARFTRTGLTIAEADALVPDLLAFTARQRRNADVETWLVERLGGSREPGAWWALRTYAPVVHAPTTDTWSFGPRPWYLAAPHQARPGDPGASVAWLVRRYLEAFGPATVMDIAQFAMVRRPMVREALELLGGVVITRRGPDGEVLHDVADASLPDADTPAPPRLMAMWDSVFLAYADRGRVIPPEYRTHVIRRNGDILPTLLVDGYVAGVWRRAEGGIEVTAFHALHEDAWEAVRREASRLARFLAPRDPEVYRRYGRWWGHLPAAQVRVLAADTSHEDDAAVG